MRKPGAVGGLSNNEIAEELVIEKSTVKAHGKRILMKLHLRNRMQAVIFAYESGLTRAAPTTVLATVLSRANRGLR